FVKIADFGLAKLTPGSAKAVQRVTKAGEFIGSPIYISPEVALGKTAGPTSDVYSLGVALFEALTGKPPFLGKTSVKTVNMHYRQTPPRLSDIAPDFEIPAALENVVLKALQKEPADRYHSMREFQAALRNSLTELFQQPAGALQGESESDSD